MFRKNNSRSLGSLSRGVAGSALCLKGAGAATAIVLGLAAVIHRGLTASDAYASAPHGQ